MRRAFGATVGAGLGVFVLAVVAQLVDELVEQGVHRRRAALRVVDDEQETPDAGA